MSRLETGKMLNPTLATLHKGAEALGRRVAVDLGGVTQPICAGLIAGGALMGIAVAVAELFVPGH